jgi:membrane carboxypeptidase/penicillin-binding protein
MPSVYQIILARRHRSEKEQGQVLNSLLRLSVAFISFVGSLLALAVIGLTGLFTILSKDLPSLEILPVLYNPPAGLILQPTQIYDRTGQHLVATLENPAAEDREYLAVAGAAPAHYPADLVAATVAAHDPEFWENSGYSLSGILTNDHPTLAQQLISDGLLWDEPPSIQRALRERILAWQATSSFGREKILEWYLNTTNYGNLAFGADAAARVYFGKSAQDLTLAESAMIAAVSLSPVLNPIDAPQAAQENKNALLEAMFAQGAITEEQYTKARGQKLTLRADPVTVDNLSPAFTNFLISQLESMFQSERFLLGGFKIISTLDYALQTQAACAADFQLSRITKLADGPNDVQRNGECEAARLLPTLLSPPEPGRIELGVNVIALKPDTGELLAMVADGVPRVSPTNPPGRPLGTLLTPFIYLSAFTRGFGPGSMVWDLPASLVEGATDIQNPDGQFHGPIRLRTAMANDYLVPAMEMLSQMGAVQVWRTAQQMGLSTLEIPGGEQALRLPLMGGNAPLLEISQAFGVFADQGILSGVAGGAESEPSVGSNVRPLSVLEVRDISGRIRLDCTDQLGGCSLIRRAVITPQLAYLITNVLSDETSRWPSLGHPNSLEIGRPAGAKLGITTGGQDAWTVGFTTDLVIGVWIGTDDPQARIAPDWVSGLWHAIIQHAALDEPVAEWNIPPGLNQIDVCNPSGLLPGPDCPETIREVYLDGTEPTHVDSLFRAFQVNRESGRLATIFTPPELVDNRVFMVIPPEAVAWAQGAGIPLPPDSYDIIDAPQGQNPNVQITSPELFEPVGGEVAIRGNAKGAAFRYFRLQVGQGLNPTNWSVIGDDQTRPVSEGQLASWDTTGLEGLYVLQLVVVREDDRVESMSIQVSVDNRPPEINVRFPTPGALLASIEDQSITLEAEASDDLGLASVEFLIDGHSVAALSSPPFASPWEPVPGAHTLIARAIDLAGNLEEASVQFTVNP